MSGRFAHSATLDDLWRNLLAGRDLVDDVSRWDLDDFYARFPENGEGYCRRASLLEDVDLFDPQFFGISGLEATYMDPQQRLFLEQSWTALEDAGYAGAESAGLACGVFAGYNGGDYHHLCGVNPPAQAMWGNAASVLSARIAYVLDLQGPALTVDTACSSSLVAIQLACQGLRTGELSLALAGGVYVSSTPGFLLGASQAGMLSPDGACYSFDHRANGFVPGEGVGVLVLKRLGDALADNDHVHGVIRGWGTNQDGATNGITAPSARSQERLERQVYDTFGIDPAGIQMVEAHGSATPLGDPIEFQALTRAFRAYTDRQGYCALGSIKTNVGHTTSAAGVAGASAGAAGAGAPADPALAAFRAAQPQDRLRGLAVLPQHRAPGLGRRRGDAPPRRGQLVRAERDQRAPRHRGGAARHDGDTRSGRPISSCCAPGRRSSCASRPSCWPRIAPTRPALDVGDAAHTLIVGRRRFAHRLACVAGDAAGLVRALRAVAAGRAPGARHGGAGRARPPRAPRAAALRQRVHPRQPPNRRSRRARRAAAGGGRALRAGLRPRLR